jgi:hypothetical protein
LTESGDGEHSGEQETLQFFSEMPLTRDNRMQCEPGQAASRRSNEHHAFKH